MLVARIYTRVPEESTELVERLRARGYTVELVDPADFRVTPADLEIRLDRMKPAEAFAAAAEFARQQRSQQTGVEVFVADGVAVDEAALRAARGESVERGNVVLDGLKRLIAPFRRLGAEAHATRAARRQQVIERETAAEAARQQLWEAKAAARAERERQEEAARAQREEMARAEREAVIARERETALAREREEDARRQEAEALKRAERAAILAREREEEARAERERQEAARRMEAEALAERERAEMVAAAEIAAVPIEPASRPVKPREVAAAAAPRPRLQISPSRNAPRQREGGRVMKRAFAAAACIAILAAMGWGAYENRTPASPLSNADRVRGNSIQQDVPFGSARINGQGSQARPSAQPATKPAQTVEAAPQPAAAKAAGSKPTAGTPKRTQRFANDSAGVIAEDQVIYHGAPKRSTSRAAAQPAPVKKISDMD